jgi:hypothetical protein
LDDDNEANVKFPKRLRFKGKGAVFVTIYRNDNASRPYNVYWREPHPETGKPRSNLKSFATYSAASKFGKQKVNELAEHKPTLSLKQTQDAYNAFKRLGAHFKTTGRHISLLAGISQICEADLKLNGRLVSDAIDGFITTVASVKRKVLAQAVEDFAALDEPRTKAPDGQRPELDPAYVRQKKAMLVKFSNMLPGHAVCDLTKAHVDMFINSLGKLASKKEKAPKPSTPKSRNHHRTVLGQFIRWAARNDYLPTNHRLLEAESLRPEKTNGGQTLFYTSKEFRLLLETAEGTMQAIVAIGGLAGLRTAELSRLDWQDVWHVAGHR